MYIIPSLGKNKEYSRSYSRSYSQWYISGVAGHKFYHVCRTVIQNEFKILDTFVHRESLMSLYLSLSLKTLMVQVTMVIDILQITVLYVDKRISKICKYWTCTSRSPSTDNRSPV